MSVAILKRTQTCLAYKHGPKYCQDNLETSLHCLREIDNNSIYRNCYNVHPSKKNNILNVYGGRIAVYQCGDDNTT